jgi:hypothetical protein
MTAEVFLNGLPGCARSRQSNRPVLFLQCQRILAIPSKRGEYGPVEFLIESEAATLVAAPDVRTWFGNRDRTLLLVAACGIANRPLSGVRMWCSVLAHTSDASATACFHACSDRRRWTTSVPSAQDLPEIWKFLGSAGGELVNGHKSPHIEGQRLVSGYHRSAYTGRDWSATTLSYNRKTKSVLRMFLNESGSYLSTVLAVAAVHAFCCFKQRAESNEFIYRRSRTVLQACFSP